MSDDLVERLRCHRPCSWYPKCPQCQAADEVAQRLARIEELEAALHLPESCKTVDDLVKHLGERQAYTKIVADSIGHRLRIEQLEAALIAQVDGYGDECLHLPYEEVADGDTDCGDSACRLHVALKALRPASRALENNDD